MAQEIKTIRIKDPEWCKAKAKDGRVCALYKEHYDEHQENHGKSAWSDGE